MRMLQAVNRPLQPHQEFIPYLPYRLHFTKIRANKVKIGFDHLASCHQQMDWRPRRGTMMRKRLTAMIAAPMAAMLFGGLPS